MKLLKRLVNAYSSVKPTSLKAEALLAIRGKYLEGKYDLIHRWQNKLARKCKLPTAKPVPSVEALRTHIKNDPVAKMYLQGGLDQIPEYVTQYIVDERGTHVQPRRKGVSYRYTWEQLLD